MWNYILDKLPNEVSEILLTIKNMITNPIMMIIRCFWIVIRFQENNHKENLKKLAEEDRNKSEDQMPNEFIQGAATAYQVVSPSIAVRSALRLQFWIFYWNLERLRVRLSRTIPFTLSEPGQSVPDSANIIPIFTENINLLENNQSINIQTINLRTLIKEGRYLALTFGSCTCPPFLSSLKSFIKLAQYYNQLNAPIDFVIIYINEAHASDGWKFDGPQYSFIANHKNIHDRIEATKTMINLSEIKKEDKISVYCDTMNDHTNHLFRGWPERLYVFHNQKILFRGQNGPTGYSIPSFDYFLKKNVLQQN